MIDALSVSGVVLTCLVFLLAGSVKGVIGLGLPTVAIAVLTAVFGLKTAIALLLAPSLATNALQALTGGHARVLAARLWPFLVCVSIAISIGAIDLVLINEAVLGLMLGVLLVAYALNGLFNRRTITVGRHQEIWAGPVFGLVSGVLTGLTGAFAFPGVVYLQALGFDRDTFIQALGLLFTVTTVTLGLAAARLGLLSPHLAMASALAVLPALAGLVAGRSIRNRLPEQTYRKVFFGALVILGLIVIGRSLSGPAASGAVHHNVRSIPVIAAYWPAGHVARVQSV